MKDGAGDGVSHSLVHLCNEALAFLSRGSLEESLELQCEIVVRGSGGHIDFGACSFPYTVVGPRG